ncbi:MAG: amidohydrolase [Nocardiopsaceae bacterium]|nr:amidohydrolase [Nocardiopsaceae bacterium]
MLPVETDPPEVTIAFGPRIETLTGSRPEALAFGNGRVVAEGAVADLQRCFPRAVTRRLPGALLVPGFNDAHLHPSFAAQQALWVDLGPRRARDRGESLALLRERADRAGEGEWIIGAGYDVVHAPPPRLDRRSLDTVSTRHPVYVIGSTWHAAVANSRALDVITADPAATGSGGTLSRDRDGELDGWMYELPHMTAAWSGSILPELPRPALAGALREQNSRLNAHGITSYTDALVTPGTWAAYELLRREPGQTARAGIALWHAHRGLIGSLPLGSGFGDEWLRFVGVKLMYDGALSGGTCLCSEPYEGPAGSGTGIQVLSRAELTEIVAGLHGRGIRACVHANGDAAIADVLDAVEAARSRFPQVDVSHRIEHCSITDDALIERIAACGVIAVPFGGFVRYYGDDLVRMYSAPRAARVARHASLLAAGVSVAGSSDFPCGPVDVLTALDSLTSRTTESGRVIGERERLDVRRALWVYTAGSALATGEAAIKGRLAPGYLADFTVLSEDILKAEPGWPDRTRIVSTWVGGRQVWPR